MKRAAMLLVACLSAMLVSSIQAADVNMMFYSQTGNSPVAVAHDVHYTLVSADGEETKVAGGIGADSTVSVAEGAYNLVVEQPSTHLFGSVNVYVAEDQDSPMLFLLSSDGLTYLEGVHPCDCEAADCDDNCICMVFNENVTNEVCHCPQSCKCKKQPSSVEEETPAQQTPAQEPAQPSQPAPAQTSPSNGNAWSTIGMLGAIGAVIAVALADDNRPPRPVTPFKK